MKLKYRVMTIRVSEGDAGFRVRDSEFTWEQGRAMLGKMIRTVIKL